MESATNFHPDLIATILQMVPSLILRTALSAIPLVSELCGNFSKDLPKCKMTFGFLVGSKNFCKLFPEKFSFCTDKIGSTELPSLVPRQRIDDCFEIHILH